MAGVIARQRSRCRLRATVASTNGCASIRDDVESALGWRLPQLSPDADSSRGSTISKTVLPGRLSTEIAPPCRSTIAFTIDSPSPLPPDVAARRRDASAL